MNLFTITSNPIPHNMKPVKRAHLPRIRSWKHFEHTRASLLSMIGKIAFRLQQLLQNICKHSAHSNGMNQ